MFRLLKVLFFLVVLAAIGLTGYTYVGPYFGVNFSPEKVEIREPVVLNAE